MDKQELIEWRRAMEWTQSQAADELGISRRTYQSLETGTATITPLVEARCRLLEAGESEVKRQQLLRRLIVFGREPDLAIRATMAVGILRTFATHLRPEERELMEKTIAATIYLSPPGVPIANMPKS